MSLLDYVRAIRQRWRLVLFVVVVTTGVALGISLSSEKQYDASAKLLLRGEEPVNALLDLGTGGISTDPDRELNTEVQLIKVTVTADAVRRQLGLQMSADDLLERIETETSSTSNIVTLTVRDRDPRQAARIVNSFAAAYRQFRLDSARRRYRDAAELAQGQLLALTPEDRRTSQGLALQARQRELQIAAALQTGGVEIVRQASVPVEAARPRPRLSAALGLAIGLILGLGAALLLNLIDRRFKDEQETESFFEVPILAAIPRPARRGAVLDDPAQREAYGLLAANLSQPSTTHGGKVVMVTSPGPGEGKTSVTIGVARGLARFGLSVIAIEGDLRRPAFSRFVDVSDSRGLAAVLDGSPLSHELLWLDPNSLGPVVDPGEGDGLVGLLPAGRLPPNPQRTLSDPAMDDAVRLARTLADVVLIDTAPVGTVNDAVMLAPVIDGVVLVVRLNQTTKDAGRRAKRGLENLDVSGMGVVVTDAGGGERHAYYGEPTTTRTVART